MQYCTFEPKGNPMDAIAGRRKLAGFCPMLVMRDGKGKQLGLGGTYAALSYDDGKTWPHVRKVEGPQGYMALAQASNGVIYHLGPSGSNPVRCVAYNEAWLKEGKPVPEAK